MLLGTYYDSVEVHREEKIIYGRLLVPHRVISTCPVAGGLRDDLTYLYNHQSSEPSGHHHPAHSIAVSDPRTYRDLICRRYRLPADQCATLGTAANMRYASIKEACFSRPHSGCSLYGRSRRQRRPGGGPCHCLGTRRDV